MRKHKRLVFGGAIVAVLVVSAFIGILVSRRYLKSAVRMPPGSIVHGSNTPNKSVAKVPVIETLKSFNEIQLSMTNKRWAEAVSKSMAYGESTDNPSNYRSIFSVTTTLVIAVSLRRFRGLPTTST